MTNYFTGLAIPGLAIAIVVLCFAVRANLRQQSPTEEAAQGVTADPEATREPSDRQRICSEDGSEFIATMIRCRRRDDPTSHDVVKFTCPTCGFSGFSREDLPEYERYLVVMAKGRIE